MIFCVKNSPEKNFKKLTPDSSSSIPITLCSRFMKNISLDFYLILGPISEVRTHKQSSNQAIKQTIFFPRLFSTRKRKNFFCKKSGLLCKKKWPEKNFEKLTPDSSSSTSITHWSSFMNNISLYFYAILRPISEVRTYKQSINQTIFFSMTLLYEKENKMFVNFV